MKVQFYRVSRWFATFEVVSRGGFRESEVVSKGGFRLDILNLSGGSVEPGEVVSNSFLRVHTHTRIYAQEGRLTAKPNHLNHLSGSKQRFGNHLPGSTHQLANHLSETTLRIGETTLRRTA